MTLFEQLKQAVELEDMDWIRQIVHEMEWTGEEQAERVAV